MPESILVLKTGSNSDEREIIYYLWPLENVRLDLIKQGGLEEHLLELPFVNDNKTDNYSQDTSSYLAVYDGKYNGIRFRMRWRKDEFLTVMTERQCPELIDAFSKILGYSPFAEYKFEDSDSDSNLDSEFYDRLPFTVEWDKNSEERYKKLEDESRKEDLYKELRDYLKKDLKKDPRKRDLYKKLEDSLGEDSRENPRKKDLRRLG